ncbi:N-acetyldiaminopimelate deacetylase, partial [Escherichia coli]|nr:N-acetyldiaminopimelate deacetylase [Escherichia coli]
LTSSNVWPGFSLDTATIGRLCACGADFGFDPYISDVPDVQCDLNTTNDFTVHFTAMLNPDERVIIAKRPLKKCDSWIEDVYIFQVFKEAWKFHTDNSLRGFRDKQAELKLYARHYSVENCTEESCRDCNYCIRPSFSLSRSSIIRLNAANARFVYQPFTRDQRKRG